MKYSYAIHRTIFALPRLIRAACLDYPIDTGGGEALMEPADGLLLIAGWILPEDLSEVSAIVITTLDGEKSVSCAAVRKDVLTKVAKISNPTEDQSRVGFVTKLAPMAEIRIDIEIAGGRYPWVILKINRMPDSFKHPNVLEGRDGWLFWQNDSNKVQEQTPGTYPLLDDFVEKWRALLNYREKFCNSRGIEYLMAVAPNKETLYADYLPVGSTLSARRPVHMVLDAVRPTPVCFPVESFLASQNYPSLYSKGDTHWDLPGAYLMYREIMLALDLPFFPESRMQYVTREFVNSDLSGKIGRTNRRIVGGVKEAKAKLFYSNGVEGVGQNIRYKRSGDGLRAVVFQDSFGNFLHALLAESFKVTTFVWQPNIDYSILENEKPDVVISIQAERFLVAVPDDENGMTNKQYAEQKNKGKKSIGLGKHSG